MDQRFAHSSIARKPWRGRALLWEALHATTARFRTKSTITPGRLRRGAESAMNSISGSEGRLAALTDGARAVRFTETRKALLHSRLVEKCSLPKPLNQVQLSVRTIFDRRSCGPNVHTGPLLVSGCPAGGELARIERLESTSSPRALLTKRSFRAQVNPESDRGANVR